MMSCRSLARMTTDDHRCGSDSGNLILFSSCLCREHLRHNQYTEGVHFAKICSITFYLLMNF
jgi:hypothetical protein